MGDILDLVDDVFDFIGDAIDFVIDTVGDVLSGIGDIIGEIGIESIIDAAIAVVGLVTGGEIGIINTLLEQVLGSSVGALINDLISGDVSTRIDAANLIFEEITEILNLDALAQVWQVVIVTKDTLAYIFNNVQKAMQEISKLMYESEALLPSFLEIYHMIVLMAASVLGQPYDIAELTWLQGEMNFLTRFQAVIDGEKIQAWRCNVLLSDGTVVEKWWHIQEGSPEEMTLLWIEENDPGATLIECVLNRELDAISYYMANFHYLMDWLIQDVVRPALEAVGLTQLTANLSLENVLAGIDEMAGKIDTLWNFMVDISNNIDDFVLSKINDVLAGIGDSLDNTIIGDILDRLSELEETVFQELEPFKNSIGQKVNDLLDTVFGDLKPTVERILQQTGGEMPDFRYMGNVMMKMWELPPDDWAKQLELVSDISHQHYETIEDEWAREAYDPLDDMEKIRANIPEPPPLEPFEGKEPKKPTKPADTDLKPRDTWFVGDY